jgi:hypothetical protein
MAKSKKEIRTSHGGWPFRTACAKQSINLGRTELQRQLIIAGIRYGRRDDVSRLRTLLDLSRRGYVPYTNCTREELLRFCEGRKADMLELTTTAFTNLSNTQLVSLLEDADEDLRFHKFFELPPELRATILELVLIHGQDGKPTEIWALDYDAWLEARGTKAVLEVCSALRSEALPIFCSVNTFAFHAKDYTDHKEVNEWLQVNLRDATPGI